MRKNTINCCSSINPLFKYRTIKILIWPFLLINLNWYISPLQFLYMIHYIHLNILTTQWMYLYVKYGRKMEKRCQCTSSHCKTYGAVAVSSGFCSWPEQRKFTFLSHHPSACNYCIHLGLMVWTIFVTKLGTEHNR